MEQTDSNLLISDLNSCEAATPAELAQKVFASKARRRSWLAALPVEEKYRRFLKLQRMAVAVQRAAGKKASEPWPE